MKTTRISRLALTSGLMIAVAMMTWLANSGRSEAQVKGGERQLNLLGIKTRADVQALKPGDAVAMACPKCKTVTVTYVSVEKGHIKNTTTGTEHLCPGCDAKFVTSGHGKAMTQSVIHICKKCGSKDAFCCATSSGSGPTIGMEKK